MATTHQHTKGAADQESGSAQRPASSPPTTSATLRLLAALRIALGVVFLWAFLDKTFGLGWATSSDRAWVNGGSPTRGYLSQLSAGPLRSVFQDVAGAGWADWLFMIGLLGVGLALVLGIGMRIAAVSGAVLLVLMWLAEWPLARTGFDGAPTGSNNPFVDSHLIDALVLGCLVLSDAGRTWGLAGPWSRLPFVRRHPVLR